MAINFAAASTAGLNNPGTEIITLVKDDGGNFVNPPSYDKMLAYLRSGDVPCLSVTNEACTTGDIYQFSGYSETENKIRFSNDANAIEFCAGCGTPVVSHVGGGGGSGFKYDFIIKTNGETYTLETGTYEAINAKLGKEPVNGKIILFAGDAYKADMNCVLVINNGERLLAYAFMGDTHTSVVINADNTVTSA